MRGAFSWSTVEAHARGAAALMLVAGAVLGIEFAWSAPALVRSIEEAAHAGHLTLGLMGAVYSDGTTSGRGFIDAAASALLIGVGLIGLMTHGHASDGASELHRQRRDDARARSGPRRVKLPLGT